MNITVLGLTNPDVNRKRMHQLYHVNTITMSGLLANIILDSFPRSFAIANTSVNTLGLNAILTTCFQKVYINRFICNRYCQRIDTKRCYCKRLCQHHVVLAKIVFDRFENISVNTILLNAMLGSFFFQDVYINPRCTYSRTEPPW